MRNDETGYFMTLTEKKVCRQNNSVWKKTDVVNIENLDLWVFMGTEHCYKEKGLVEKRNDSRHESTESVGVKEKDLVDSKKWLGSGVKTVGYLNGIQIESMSQRLNVR